MKLFLAFLLLCFMGGAALWAAPQRWRLLCLFALSLLVAVGFIYFNQI